MTASARTAQLQHAILRVAARNEEIGFDLDRARTPGADHFELPPGLIAPGDRVLVVGLTGSELARQVIRRDDLDSVLVIERDPDLCRRFEADAVAVAVDGAESGGLGWYLEQTELEDLRTDPKHLTRTLRSGPVGDLASYRRLQDELALQCHERPLVPDGALDVAILDSLNRLTPPKARTLLAECFRALRRSGKLLVNVILADEALPNCLRPLLDGLKLSFVPCETEILGYLDDAGFYGMAFERRGSMPSKVVGGIELRRHVLTAHKGKQGPCIDRGHAVMYRGPWRQVLDDDGHVYLRGERTAVCEKTYELLGRAPYAGHFLPVPPYTEVPREQAPVFDCDTPQLRSPRVTKGVATVFDDRSASGDGGSTRCENGPCC